MDVRSAEPSEIPRLAQLWLDAWRDAHAALVPAELLALRTLPSFTERLRRMLPNLRVVGVVVAWLSCAIGNKRAARFYEKWGWRRTGTMISRPETSAGPFPLEVWRYEKRLVPTGPA